MLLSQSLLTLYLFLAKSMDLIWRTRNGLLGCFHKSFSHLKVKNPNVPLRKFFLFFYFVPDDRNCTPPNLWTIKIIFDWERAQKPKTLLLKILRHCPTLRIRFFKVSSLPFVKFLWYLETLIFWKLKSVLSGFF